MLGNWIKQTTTSTGTGNLTLASVSGFPTFANQFSVGEYFYYGIIDDSTGGPIESGIGHLSDSTTLVRDKVLATYVSGTYSDNDPSAATLSAGTKRVICAAEQGTAQANPAAMNAVSSYKLLYPSGQLIPSSAGAIALTANIVYYIPTLINSPRTLDAIQFRVSVLAASSAAVVGIYNSGMDGKPSSRIDQSSAVATDTTGVKVGTLTKRRYKPGLYFLAIACNGTPTLNQANTTGIIEPLMGGDFNMLGGIAGFYESTSGNTLPATAAVTSGLRTPAEIPLLALRMA